MAQTKEFNLQIVTGGIGDMIASLPAVRYLASQALNTKFTVIYPDYFQAPAYRLLPLSNVKYIRTSDAKVDVDGKLINWNAQGAENKNYCTTLKTHMTDHALATLADCRVESIIEKAYPQIAPVRKRRAVVITTGFTAPVRTFGPPAIINKIARLCGDSGCHVYWLGSKQAITGSRENVEAKFTEGIDFTYGEDLRDRTTLLQALDLINESLLVIGVDNGLLHLASCTNTPVIAGFTNVSPHLRIPYGSERQWTTIVPNKTTCNHCQSSTFLDFDADFRRCITHPGNDTMCSYSIPFEAWSDAIVGVLDP